MSIGIIASQAPNILLNLDASDLSTIIESGGAASQWNDKNGNGKNVIQGTGAEQPLTGVATINGLNTITFDGANDNMIHTGSLGISGSSAGTVFIVSRIDASAPASNLAFSFGNPVPAGGDLRGFDINSTDNSSGYRFNDGNRLFLGNPWGAVARISTWTWASGAIYQEQELYVDGLLAAASGSTNPNNVPNIQDKEIVVAAIRNAPGDLINFGEIDIGEIIVYSRELSTVERQEEETRLADKWGITLVFPLDFSGDFTADFS